MKTIKTDTEVQRDVLDELVWEPGVNAAEIGVSVEGGVVILNGTVKSLSEKWAAERATQRVNGVRAITDELVVDIPGEARRGDAEIARTAAIALDWHTAVPAGLKILVDHGRITLEGEVEYHFQRDAAAGAICNLAGVKEVINMITVKPKVSEADVKYEIFKALERAAQVEASNISVDTFGSLVILRGSAKNWAEREEAERAAWGAPGVTEVQNEIQIAA